MTYCHALGIHISSQVPSYSSLILHPMTFLFLSTLHPTRTGSCPLSPDAIDANSIPLPLPSLSEDPELTGGLTPARENSLLIWDIQFLTAGPWWNAAWMSSSERPCVSGMYIESTMTVPSVRKPKRKYAPKADLERKTGVAKATSQFVKKLTPLARQFALALVRAGWISLA
jgi:hypothetical protein